MLCLKTASFVGRVHKKMKLMIKWVFDLIFFICDVFQEWKTFTKSIPLTLYPISVSMWRWNKVSWKIKPFRWYSAFYHWSATTHVVDTTAGTHRRLSPNERCIASGKVHNSPIQVFQIDVSLNCLMKKLNKKKNKIK